jgi:prepilin-type N-terminal cleavage/methylation domain-containing protein
MSGLAHIHPGQSGMTLIELVVVLALLAGLATMALTGVADLGSRGRYDETTARLRLIRQAVAGDGIEAGRFVRDMGRLPLVQGGGAGQALAELWRDAGGVGYGPATNAAAWPDSIAGLYPHGDVKLICGWNGPYLMVDDPARAESFDGFGNPWGFAGSGVGAAITNVVSYGSDGSAGGSAWDEQDRTLDVAALLPATELAVVVKARASTNAGEAAWALVEDAGGATNAAPYQLDRLVVAVFAPSVGGAARSLRRELREGVASIASFAGLMPTDCLIYAYGTNGVTTLQVSGAEPELVTLRPGRNTVTLYLKEALP